VSGTERLTRPYKGLIPYAEEDAPFFFGREAERELVIANLLGARLTVLYGPSGAGKSSLLRAGVEHRLHALAQENLDEQGAPEMAVAVFSAWQGDPVVELLATVGRAVLGAWGERRTFEPVPNGLPLAEGLAAWADRLGGLLLIVLDQFEEAFLYQADDGDPGSFWNQLARAVRKPDLQAGFLISLREDALATLDRLKGKIPDIFSNTLRLDHLDRASARKAITGPLVEWNRRFGLTGEAALRAEPELIEEVLDEVIVGKLTVGDFGQGVDRHLVARGTQRIETHHLQLVLSRLWEEEEREGSFVLRRSTLAERLGGPQKIVRTHLGEVLSTLTDAERTTAAHVLRNMVLPSGAKASLGVDDVAELSNHPAKEVEPVLRRLAEPTMRVLRPVTDNFGVVRYELFHDVLAAAALDWRRGFEQRRKTRKWAAWLAIAVCALVLMTFLLVFAYKQQAQAERQARIAASRGRVAQGFLLPRDQLGLKLLLLAEASRTPELLAKHALLTTLQEVPGLLSAQDEPDGRVFAHSPNGQYVAWRTPNGELQLWTIVPHRRQRIALAENAAVLSVAFSPDGRTLAVALWEPDDHLSVQLWETSGGRLVGKLPWEHSSGSERDYIMDIAFSSDGRQLAGLGRTRTQVWDVVNRRTIGPKIPFRLAPYIWFSPGDEYLVTHREIWSIRDHRWVHAEFGLSEDTASAFSSDGRLLAVGDKAGVIAIWRVREKRMLGEPFALLTKPITRLAFGSGDRILAAGDNTGTTRLWSVTERHPISREYWGGGATRTLALNSRGTLLATGGNDGTVDLRPAGQEPRHPSESIRIQGHDEAVAQLRFSRKDTELISISQTGSRRTWSVSEMQNPPLYKVGLGRGLRSSLIALSPEGDLVASTDLDGQIHLWSVSRRSKAGTILRHAPTVSSLSFSADGRLLASGGGETIQLWSMATRKAVGRIRGHEAAAVSVLAFSPDGQLLASGGSDGTVRFWSIPAQKPVGTPLSVGHSVQTINFSPDGNVLAVGNEDGARLWSIRDRLPLGKLLGISSSRERLTFSPNGRFVAVSNRATTRIWSLKEHRQICTLESDQIAVNGLAFSPDEKTLAAAGFNGTIRLWSIEECQPLGKALKGPLGWAVSVAFSRDGRTLASGHYVYSSLSDAPSLFLWDVDPASWRDRACRIAGRNFSAEEWREYQGTEIPYECTCPKLPPGEGVERCPKAQ
jgi:WD40 repeat protein